MGIEVESRPPKAALAYWKSRAAVMPAEYEALGEAARRRAFAVAGLNRRAQVEAVHQALTEALDKGLPLSAFKKRLRPLLEEKGWAGKKAWRIENVYRTNMQSAYMAGRYEALEKASAGRPFWRYLAVKDRRTRPTHAAMNGKVYPHGHQFWATWYPPNGFKCRCTVQSLSQRQVDKRGLAVEEDMPGLIEPVDPRTGEVLPARPLVPDPGWAGNVGRDWLSGLAPRELDRPLKDLAVKTICRKGRGEFAAHSGKICAPPLKGIDKRHILPVSAQDIMAKGLAPEEYVKAFLGEFGVADIGGSVVHELPGGIPVVVSKALFVDKRTGKWKVIKSGRERYVRLLARTIKGPYEIWHASAQVANRPTDVLRLLRLFADSQGRIGGFSVFNLVGGSHWSGATAFTVGMEKRSVAARERAIYTYLERQRGGTLIYREK